MKIRTLSAAGLSVLALLLGTAVPADAATAPVPAPAGSSQGLSVGSIIQNYYTSREKAYTFLDGRMDEFGSGSALRLPRSYQGGYFATLPSDFVSSFAYDDSLIIQAYLGRGRPQDVGRARILGDALVYLQAHDPAGDGRTRASYQPDNFPVQTPARPIDIGSAASFTGNQAWVGMAFARLYSATGDKKYLTAALAAGQWIQANTADTTRAPYGYTGGQNADGVSFTFKATEHNIDVTAFFTQLATITKDPVWTGRAALAASFVKAMQDPSDGHLWTGTNPDGTTTNYYPIPEDVQTWAYLATNDQRYSRSVTWVTQNLQATDGPYSGPSFSNTDTSKVWFEGSGHLALALLQRHAPGDLLKVKTLLDSVQTAQKQEPHGDGKGIVAASSDGLDTGFGDTYYASLHTGASAWYLLAMTDTNPFRLQGRGVGR